MLRFYFSLFFFVGVLATPLFAQENITVTVEPFKNAVNDWAFRVLRLNTSLNSIEYIEGFDFEWGYRYQLVVKKEQIAQPMADASSVKYTLKKVISKERVDTNTLFQMRLETKLYLSPNDTTSTFVQLNDSTYTYFDEVVLVIPKTQQEEFSETIRNRTSHKVEFCFTDDRRIRFIRFI